MLPVVRILGTGAASRAFALLLGTIALGGCSLQSARDGARLSISMPNPHSFAQSNLAGGSSGLAPSAWNAPEFVCYGVNVTGPGIADSSLKPNPNPSIQGLLAGTTSCAYRGVVSNGFTFPAGQSEATIDLQVPPGSSRVIQLVGITNPAFCGANFLDNAVAGSPGAYEIGRTVADLFGDATVSIGLNYVSSESKRVDCGGSAATVQGPPALVYSPSSVSLTKGTAVAAGALVPTNTGGPATSCTISPSLSPGLSLNSATCEISGTPTSFLAAVSYTLTAVNADGSGSATVSIAVNDQAPAIVYSGGPYSLVQGVAMTTIAPSFSGGAIVNCTISPAVPSGLSFNSTTCALSGTPISASAAITYTVTATSFGGTPGSTTFSLGVASAPALAVAPLTKDFGSVNVGSNSAAQTFTFSNAGQTAATGCAAPTISDATNFTIVSDGCGTSNLAGSGGSCTVSVRGNPATAGAKSATLSRICTLGGTVSTTANQITVTGVTPALAWNPLSFSFANIAVGAAAPPTSVFTLTNSGSGTASGCSAPTLSNSTDFAIYTDNCGVNDLLPSGTCTVVVKAHPTIPSVVTTTLSRTCAVGGTVSTTANQITATGVAFPTVAITSPAAGTFITSANVSSFTVSGTCNVVGATLNIVGGAVAGATCNGSTWTKNLDFSAVPDGSVTVTVHMDNAVGTDSAVPATRTFTKDAVVPAVAITTPPAGSFVNSVNAAAFTVSGTCSENARNVVLTGAASATVSCVSGTWTSSVDLSGAADGAIVIFADHSDAAGNAAPQASRSLNKDVSIPIVTSISVGNVSPTFTKDIALTSSFSEGIAQYCINVNDTNSASCSYVSAAFPATFALPPPLVTGVKTLSVWVMDAAGNVSPRYDVASFSYDSSCDTMVGDGLSVGSAYVIDNLPRLASCLPLRDGPGVYFKMLTAANLAVSGINPLPPFRGILDGQNATLNGFNMSGPGLFSQIMGGQVRNLVFSSPTLNCISPCGILAGETLPGTLVDHVQIVGTPSVAAGSSDDVGGLVGRATDSVFSNNFINGLTLASDYNAGSNGGVGGMIGTFRKSTSGGGADLLKNQIKASQYPTNQCPSSGGGLVGSVESIGTSAAITFDQNAVQMDFNCGSPASSRLGGAIGIVKNTSYTGVTFLFKNFNVRGNMSGSAGTWRGGIFGIYNPFSGDSLVVSTSYYGGTMNFGAASVSGIGPINGTANVAFTNNVWEENGAYFAPNASDYGAPTTNTSSHASASTVLSVPSTFPTGTDWVDPSIWISLGVGVEPKLVFEQ